MKKPTKEVNRWTYAICAFTLCATSATAVLRYMDTTERRALKDRVAQATLVSQDCQAGSSSANLGWRAVLASVQGYPAFQKRIVNYKDTRGEFQEVITEFVSVRTASKSVDNGCKKIN